MVGYYGKGYNPILYLMPDMSAEQTTDAQATRPAQSITCSVQAMGGDWCRFCGTATRIDVYGAHRTQ